LQIVSETKDAEVRRAAEEAIGRIRER
jgi:hypothetical protein